MKGLVGMTELNGKTLTEAILKQGFLDVKVSVSGFRQAHRLVLVMEKVANGEIPFLVAKHPLPAQELIRLATDTGLPVRYGKTAAFPPGKAPSDYVTGAHSGVSIGKLEAQTVEMEIE